jgi:hypothetical protein
MDLSPILLLKSGSHTKCILKTKSSPTSYEPPFTKTNSIPTVTVTIPRDIYDLHGAKIKIQEQEKKEKKTTTKKKKKQEKNNNKQSRLNVCFSAFPF